MICPNCDHEFEGHYCPNCGQRAVAHLRPTLHDLSHEALHEFAHVDSKIVRTAALLLFKPGALTREFNEGKRARSISPVRLYLLASVLFFGMLHLVPTSQKLHVSVTKGADAKITQAAQKVNRDPKILSEALSKWSPYVMWVLMPLFALIVFAFYFHAERLYIPHLYFAIHYHAFAFTALGVTFAMRAFQSSALPI